MNPGDWSKSETWDKGTIPGNNDIVVIPPGFMVTVKGDVYHTSTLKPSIDIRISGTLQFEASGVLDLGVNTVIRLYNEQALITSTNGAGSERIIINDVIKFWAKETPMISGPAYSNSATPAAPAGFGPGVLPIKLQSFTAQAQASRVVLKWTTLEETGNSHFVVEKSANARQWEPVQTIPAKGQPADYTSSDAVPAAAEVFYRLKSVDLDGTSHYSHVVKVARSRSLAAYISPNPARGQVSVSLSTAAKAPVLLQLAGSNGQVLREGFYARGSSLLHLSLQGVPAGVYTLVLREGATLIEAVQLLVQ